ncbi:AlpA family phage regulatory protein [Pseudomonas sp. NP21570]|uniref:helix-turn-helix transcriptional regulator n=1 Tax=Stutzerimonas kunmingensis TaxID=1211807 RepID=UPI001E3068B1|nr:AlpA family phage regulatory protein [Stutzerimonas kunmingensis]MCB4796693.1 AlpA family phage regulatory protein [Pseudomonas sp. NP21570]
MSTRTATSEVDELRFLRLPEVEKTVGKKRSTIYRDIAAGRFPAPYDLGNSRSVGWLSTEISAWILSRPRAQLRATDKRELSHE